jgi:hypothetical protein
MHKGKSMKNLLLVLAGLLIVIGLFKPDLSSVIKPSSINENVVVIEKPSNTEILDECQDVIDALKASGDRKVDGKRLASLYSDLATLVGLDGEDLVVKNTEEIRQANRLTGAMLKLDIKGKYPELAKATNSIIVSSMGDDSVMLDEKLRQDAIDGFKALAWACQQGAK